MTFAVTGMPDAKASDIPSRMWAGPPMRDRKCDWMRPGMRRPGETNIMRREGDERIRRYWYWGGC